MGAWGTGFYSDDETLDIKDTYLDLLRKKVPPEEAVAQMMEEWKPDKDQECGYFFWLTIALLQWEYGTCPRSAGRLWQSWKPSSARSLRR